MTRLIAALFALLSIFPEMSFSDSYWDPYPQYGYYTWKAPVSSSSALPVTGNTTGDARIDLTLFEIWVWNGSSWVSDSGSGTVTSVGLSDGSSTPIYNISGSPVTGTGTLTFTFKTETANTALMGPTGGSAAQPGFRALVANDIPSSLNGTTFIGTVTGPTGVFSNQLSAGSMVDNGVLGVTGLSTLSGGLTVSGGAVTGPTGNWSGPQTNTFAETASTPPLSLTGAPVTGSTSTDFPVLDLDSGATRPSYSNSGEYFGLNAPSGYVGRFIHESINGNDVLTSSQGSLIGIRYGAGFVLTGRAFGGTILSPSATSGGTTLLELLGSGYDGTNTQSGANISINTLNTWSSTDRSSYLSFAVAPSGSTTVSEKMRLDASGHIFSFGVESGTAGSGGGTGGGAACFTSGQELISNAANCIASRLEWKQDRSFIEPEDALNTVSKLAKDAIYYRYTDEFLGTSKDKPHARDQMPGFGAEWVASDDPRYAIYDDHGVVSGVRYEQLSATEAVAISALRDEIKELRADILKLKRRK